MTVILSQQFFLGEGVPVGLLTAVLTRALALHSRQGREPLRGNNINQSITVAVPLRRHEPVAGDGGLRGPQLSSRGPRGPRVPNRGTLPASSDLEIPILGSGHRVGRPQRPLVRTAYPRAGWSWPAFPRSSAFAGVSLRPLPPILAVGAEALPVTPSGGALFAS